MTPTPLERLIEAADDLVKLTEKPEVLRQFGETAQMCSRYRTLRAAYTAQPDAGVTRDSLARAITERWRIGQLAKAESARDAAIAERDEARRVQGEYQSEIGRLTSLVLTERNKARPERVGTE